MLVALAFWGFRMHTGVLAWVAGVGAPAVCAVVWSIFVAPKSARRASRSIRVFVELVLFIVTALLLARAGQQAAALVFAIVAVSTSILNAIQEGPDRA